MAEVASEQGAVSATVARVVARAGVSRRTFYEVFDDCEDCFLSTLEEGVARASECVLPAYQTAGEWRERIRASLIALLRFFDEEPFLGRVLVVESLGAGRNSLELRSRVLARLVMAVDARRSEARVGAEATSLVAEATVGAVFSVIHGRLLERSSKPLLELVNPLMSMIVLPYAGPAAARRELKRPVVKAVTRDTTRPRNPLKGLEMRLTYRTVRVLGAVASHPASSNRVIAEASGIGDQGQISKLLARLERLGLIENRGVVPARGEPNEWKLTQRGGEVHSAVATQSSPA